MCTVFYIIIKWLSQLEDEKEADNVTPYALLVWQGSRQYPEADAGLILILVLKPAIMLIRQKRWKEVILYLCMGIGSYNTLAYKDSMDIRIFVISFSGVGYILCRLEASCPGSRIGCCGD